MDSIFSIFTNNPLPVTLSVVIALACLAVFYFFVIPLFAEVKQLKAENAELRESQREKDNGSIDLIQLQLETLDTTLTQFKEVITQEGNAGNSSSFVDELLTTVTGLHELVEGHANGNVSNIQDIRTSLHRITEMTKGNRIREESLDRSIQEVMRTMRDMSDKQSQIIGALLGMSRLNDRNRGI
jgi:signal transduction histidine kinase